MPAPLVENAPAKVNLTLRVLGRRDDGYHEIESLVAFADWGDRLTLMPDSELALAVSGPRTGQAGAGADNLVLRAAPRRCGLSRGRTIFRPATRIFTKRRVRPAPTCRSVSIRARG